MDMKTELMRLEHTVEPDFSIKGSDATEILDAMEHMVDRMQIVSRLGLAGAMFGALFQEYPFLKRFTVSLSAEIVMGDEGQQYRSTNLNVGDVEFVAGASIPDEFGTADEPETNIFEGHIEGQLEGYESDLYNVFNEDESDLADHDLVLDRETISSLLHQGQLKGLECIERFFPELYKASFAEAVSAMERSDMRIKAIPA